MSFLDSVISGVLKNALDQNNSAAMPDVLSQVLGKTELGSVGGLLTQLQSGGLGNLVASWLSNGQNLPLSADQLRSVLGQGQMQQLAGVSGLPIENLLAMLSQHLPQAVDTMSPDGTLVEPAAPAGPGTLSDEAGLKDI